MRSVYYKGELGTGRKTKAQRELEKEEVRFRVRRGKFRVIFDYDTLEKDCPESEEKNKFDFCFDKFETKKNKA